MWLSQQTRQLIPYPKYELLQVIQNIASFSPTTALTLCTFQHENTITLSVNVTEALKSKSDSTLLFSLAMGEGKLLA